MIDIENMKKSERLNSGHLLLTIILSNIDTLIVPRQMFSTINKLTLNGLVFRRDVEDLFMDELAVLVLTSPSLPNECRT